MVNLVQLLKKVKGTNLLKRLKTSRVFDLTSQESAISAIICSILAMIFGAIAIISAFSIFAGASIGIGLWALTYGLMAFFKKESNRNNDQTN